MVKRYLRSSKIVIKKRVLPSGRVGFLYRKKKTSKPVCGDSGEILNGTAYGRKRDLRNLSKTEKRPTRYYGGVLSVNALKKRILDKIFSESA